MSLDDLDTSKDLNLGADASLGLSSDLSKAEQELLGQAAKRQPSALGNASHLVDGDSPLDVSGGADELTGLTRSPFLGDGPLYGDEFESGIVPIDYAAYQIGKAYQAINHVVEDNKPVMHQAAERATSYVVQELRDNLQLMREDWNAPDNDLRHFVEEKAPQLFQQAKQWWKTVQSNPRVQELTETVVEFGRNISDRAGEVAQSAQGHAEQWSNRLFEESYTGNQANSLTKTHQQQGDLNQSPFVGVIDTKITENSHGAQVAQMVERKGQESLDWYGDGVGSGNWSQSLVQFVDAAKASGQPQAVANLSFDLTQVNPDGSVNTRHELTTEEYEALSYARDNDVLLVVATGNQGSEMSALGKASQEFDNIIAVGAVEKGQRADYSSYGDGVDFVASGQGRGEIEGTSLSAARVTGAIAQIWKTNPDLSYQQVIQALEKSATDLQDPGIDSYTGSGKLNVDRAVEIAEDGLVEEGDRSKTQKTTITQPVALLVEDTPFIPSERPAFLETLEEKAAEFGESATDTAGSIWGAFKENVAEPIVEQLPEPVEEFVRNAGNTVEETVSGIANDPGSTPEILQEAASDIHTAFEGTTYPGYTFEYEPGTTPEYDPKVQQWQERMLERGWRISADGYYGAHSAEVARQFQQEKGLTPDGIVGSDTWAATFSTRNEVDPSGEVARGALPVGVAGTGEESSRVFSYEPGQDLSYNPYVEQWQSRMRERGWNIEADGYYGEHSAEVARQFQEEKGLVADGIVGERTWEEAFRTDNITSSSNGASVGSGLSASYGEPVSNAAPDSRYSQYSGQMTENSDLSDNMRAFLDTISYAEGTYSPDGYRIRFGGDRFDSFTDHPRIHEPFRDTTSTAAGRYQFIQGTWDGVRSQLGLSDFSPENQDLAAVQLIRNRGAYEDVEAGRFETAVAKVAGEWASFPGAGYNQPEKSLTDLREFYETSLQNYQSEVEPIGNADSESLSNPQPVIRDGMIRDGIITLGDKSGVVSLHQYDENGPLTDAAIDPKKETVLITHGYDGSYAHDGGLDKLAKQVSASADVQVITLDWSDIAGAGFDRELSDWVSNPIGTALGGFPPYDTAKWIVPVAEWAQDTLSDLSFDPSKLTLIGHSFGTYVNAEIASQFGKVKNFVALDPAFLGGAKVAPYDTDGRTPEIEPPEAFRDVAGKSLAFVAKNQPFSTNRVGDVDVFGLDQGLGGVSGDNDQAATAHDSFVVDFPEGEIRKEAHSVVVDVFTDALKDEHLTLPDLTLPTHQDNWYSDNGNKQNLFNRWLPDPVKGTFDLNHHEGRITVNGEGEIQEMVRVIDDSGTEEPDWT